MIFDANSSVIKVTKHYRYYIILIVLTIVLTAHLL